ncbi:MAG: hypothetical protein JNK10_12130 [Cyclobacteriaceae bacterium]|nr:hypothetical protein [Cyclobacteriaceae bacterium]
MSQLYSAFDRGYIPEGSFVELKADVEVISKQLSTMISYLKKSPFKGAKFH